MSKDMPCTDAELDVQAGQMLMVGFDGVEAASESPVMRDIARCHLGGVILFDRDVARGRPLRNIHSPSQLRRLTRRLQETARIPLLIGIDQEGGRVCRLRPQHGFPPSVSARRLGEADRPQWTYREASATAEVLAHAGINLNFAPVVDCDVNPRNPVIGGLERSFSSCPQTVARHALEAIRAHCHHGVISVLKHFPGHGSSSQDSHEGFVDVTRTWSTLELEPYETIISTGLCEAVMTAHIFNARLDPRFPATLSHSIVTGILRRKLGYDGVVFSDDMQMKAISDHYGLETAVGLAIEAGVDVLLFGNNLAFDEDLVPNLLETLKGLVSRGHVRRERIHESFQRIMKLKEPLFHIPERLTIL